MKHLPPTRFTPPTLSEEDHTLWHASLTEVQPLHGKAYYLADIYTPPTKKIPIHSPIFSELSFDDDRGLYAFDPHTLRRLTRQRIHPDMTVDLHDLTQTEAHARLVRTIEDMMLRRQRILLVITGKGTTERPSILRAILPRWCEEAPLRGRVIALHHATQPHGGKGAFYLHLRAL